MTDDATLLRRYAEERSEPAFTALVQRHIPLVYSAALRRTYGDAHHAADVTQQVFIDLAHKAGTLSRHAALGAWLYTATRYVAHNLMLSEQRRRQRERAAEILLSSAGANDAATDWEKLRPVLDRAMDELAEFERTAVVLRFFEKRPFAEIGATLRLSEDAARMRVERALDKLRTQLARRGVTSTTAALGLALTNEAVAAVPVGLAGSVTKAALAGVTMAGGGTGAIFTLMSTTKLLLSSAGALVLAGLGVAIYQAGETRRTNDALTSALRERDAAHARIGVLETRAQAAEQNTVSAATRIAALEKQLAAAAPKTPGAPNVAARSIEARPPQPPPRDDPAVQQEIAKLHRRYDPLLQQRGLTPAQMERFIELMWQKNQVRADVQAAVEQAGARGDDPGVMALRAKLDGPLWQEMRELLGPDGMKVFSDYEQTSGYRMGMVEPMRPNFAAANAPLTPEQEERLVRIIMANTRSQRGKATDLGMQRQWDMDAIAAQADTVLTPAQRPIFQSFLQKWKAATK